MDFLRRYLQEIRFWLPIKHQDDIIAEISEDLRSRVEDRELALSRCLTPDEWRTLLKERGNPLQVANSYHPSRYLIGPAMFPVYWLALRVVLICAIVPSIAAWIGKLILLPAYRSEMAHAWFPALWACFYWPAVFTFLPLTLAFAVLERIQPGWLFLWNPADGNSASPRIVRDTGRIPRSTSVFELVVTVLFLVWTLRAAFSQELMDRPTLRIALTSSGRLFLFGLIVLSIASLVISGSNLVRPYWTRMRCAIKSATHAAAALVFASALLGRSLIEITGTGVNADAARSIDSSISTLLLAGILIALLHTIFELRKALRRDASLPSIENSQLGMSQ